MPKEPSSARETKEAYMNRFKPDPFPNAVFWPWISWVLCWNQESGRRVKRCLKTTTTDMDMTNFMFSGDDSDLHGDLRYFGCIVDLLYTFEIT
jgi:hypothetical protein